MSIEELVKNYKLSLLQVEGEYKIRVGEPYLIDDQISDHIKTERKHIISYLRLQEDKKLKVAIDRQDRISAIEDLEEIQDCMESWAEYKEDFNDMMESGRGYMKVTRPNINVEDLRKKYPRADAYLKAYQLAHKSNYELADIGRRSLEKIIYDNDFSKVIAEMDKELDAFTERHLWD